jgi:hypothetical protein
MAKRNNSKYKSVKVSPYTVIIWVTE